MQAREQAVVVGDPVEGGGREDRVGTLLELELEQIELAQLDTTLRDRGRQPASGGLDHRRGGIHRDHPPARQPRQQRLADAARSAARIDHELSAVQLEASEHPAPQ